MVLRMQGSFLFFLLSLFVSFRFFLFLFLSFYFFLYVCAYVSGVCMRSAFCIQRLAFVVGLPPCVRCITFVS